MVHNAGQNSAGKDKYSDAVVHWNDPTAAFSRWLSEICAARLKMICIFIFVDLKIQAAKVWATGRRVLVKVMLMFKVSSYHRDVRSCVERHERKE